jgi:opacity protein-like surface antigen
MKMRKLPILAPAVAALALLCLQPPATFAGAQGFSKNSLSGKEFTGTTDEGRFERFPLRVSVTVRGGYDDNVNLTPTNEQDSFFVNSSLELRYDFGGPRTRASLFAGAGVTYYFDREEDDEFVDIDDGEYDGFDFNVYAGFNITHKATPRLILAANLFASYQSQPDFQSFNVSTVTFSRTSQDFFITSNRFSIGYAWAPRFSTVTSYTLGYIDFEDELQSFYQDRFEHTIGNEFRFLLLPTTTLVAEYRFGIVDYLDDQNRDSHSHFLLGGVDHSFSPRLNASVRAGVEFRSFDDEDIFFAGAREDNRTHPYFEGTVNYAVAQSTSISWTNRYSLEQPDVPDAFSRSTFRTSLGVRHAFTPRITAGLNVAYQHDDNEGAFGLAGFDEDAFDIALSVRYAINRNWALDAGYHHTQVISDEALFREYARNRFWLGATFSF